MEKAQYSIHVNLQIEGGQLAVSVIESPFGPQGTVQTADVASLLADAKRRDPLDLLADGQLHDEKLKDIGKFIFELLIPPRNIDWWRRVMELCRESLIVMYLQIEDKRLASLPWELAFDSSGGEFVSLHRHFSIVRLVRNARSATGERFPAASPLNIVAILASPAGMAPLDIDLERRSLEQALAIPLRHGQVTLEMLFRATAAEVREALQSRTDPVHVLHIGTHTGLEDGRPIIYLEDESGVANPVQVSQLVKMINDPLRLVNLMVENSGGTALSDQSPVAQAIVREGVPAAIGLQNMTNEQTVINFVRLFYQGIADGSSLAASLTDARISMNLRANEQYWHSPILFVHDKVGSLPLIGASAAMKGGIRGETNQRQDAVSIRGGAVIGGDQLYQDPAERVNFRGLATPVDEREPVGGGTLEMAGDPEFAYEEVEEGQMAPAIDAARLKLEVGQLKAEILGRSFSDHRQKIKLITALEQIEFEISQPDIDVRSVIAHLREIEQAERDLDPQTAALRQLLTP